LKEAQSAYREAVEALKADPRQSPAAFRPGIIAQHNLLNQKLPGLLAAFSGALHEQTYGFFPVGAESESWAAEALREATDGVLVDSLALYRELASDRIWNSMDRLNRFFGPTQFSILDDELRGVGEKLTDEHIPFPEYINQAALTRREDLADRIQTVLEKSFGLKYRIMYIRKQITDGAAKLDLQGVTVPVIITGVDLMNRAADLGLELFAPGRTITVNTENLGGAEYVKQSVQKAFAEVKKSLRRKTPKTNPKDETNG
jgi:hypothetical protein